LITPNCQARVGGLRRKKRYGATGQPVWEKRKKNPRSPEIFDPVKRDLNVKGNDDNLRKPGTAIALSLFDKRQGAGLSSKTKTGRSGLFLCMEDDVSENAVELYIGRLRNILEGSSVQINNSAWF